MNARQDTKSIETLDSLQESLQKVDEFIERADDNSRLAAVESARKLLSALEKPEDVVMRYAWETGSQRMALRLGVDLGLFHTLAQQNGHPITSGRLGEIAGAQQLLIVRVMRVITAMGFASEAGVQSYVATPLTKAITKPAMEAAVKICHDNSLQIQVKMHDYFRSNGYNCPTDSSACAFQWTFNTNLSYFQTIYQDQQTMRDFTTFMTGNRVNRKHWIEWFPVPSNIIAGASDGILIVDLGGGKGHDLERFLGSFPDCKGRLVLQELPGVVERLDKLHDGIKVMPHNFFDPQPVRGARVYYTHFVLHDWPDEKCQEILRNIMPAMTPGYSKILLNESVLPDTGCPAGSAAGDINMMSIMAGKKRSQGEWVDLVESVGLAVTKIWKSPYGADDEGVVEIALK